MDGPFVLLMFSIAQNVQHFLLRPRVPYSAIARISLIGHSFAEPLAKSQAVIDAAGGPNGAQTDARLE
jgi:hypothetical protein